MLPGDHRQSFIEDLADANRQAAQSGNKEQLYASQKALADALNKLPRMPDLGRRAIDLSRIDLGGYREPIRCSIRGFDFNEANLSHANFSDSTFFEVSFYRAIFDHTVAKGTSFHECTFAEAVIDAADFSQAWFLKCTLHQAIFREFPKVTYATMYSSWVSRPFHDYLKGHLSKEDMPKVFPFSAENA